MKIQYLWGDVALNVQIVPCSLFA